MATAYATVADLDADTFNRAFSSLSTPTKQAALDQAADYIDGYLGGQYTLPLISWPASFKSYAVAIAAYLLMRQRGFNPDDGADNTFRMAYDDATQWLDGVSRGRIKPPGIVDGSASVSDGAPIVTSGASPGALYAGSGMAPTVATSTRRWR